MPKYNKTIKITLLVIGALALFYLATIPWRNYIYRGQIDQGKNLLAELKYTDAMVKFEKAAVLKPFDPEPESLQKMTRDAAGNILIMKDFLSEQNQTDLLSLINSADSKTCNLETDRTLIEKNLPEIAKINLEFCAESGPKNYDSWLFLGLANQRLSESGEIFKEQKPGLRQAAADAYAKAYAIDPINKSAIEYLIKINKTLNNQSEVDRWQKLLDELNKISS
jgi:tetratricopeptide (TPR) repeat protein